MSLATARAMICRAPTCGGANPSFTPADVPVPLCEDWAAERCGSCAPAGIMPTVSRTATQRSFLLIVIADAIDDKKFRRWSRFAVSAVKIVRTLASFVTGPHIPSFRDIILLARHRHAVNPQGGSCNRVTELKVVTDLAHVGEHIFQISGYCDLFHGIPQLSVFDP